MNPLAPCPRPPSGEAGFTLIESLVALVITAEVMLVALLLFDVNGRIARNQTQIADLQQSQRIAHNDVIRLARMAGRGGLPAQFAAVVDDNVAATDTVAGNAPVAETDVLTVRGVFNNPVWQVDFQNTANFVAPVGNTPGTVKIRSVSPTGVAQSLDALTDLAASGNSWLPDGLILVSSTNDAIWAVVQITDIAIATIGDLDGDGTADQEATIDFSGSTTTSPNSSEYLEMSSTPGGYPGTLDSVGFAGLVEEYRFYVRDANTAVGGYSPKLSRARFYPNTDTVYPGSGNDKIDIAENVFDFQLVEGRDTNGDGVITEHTNNEEDEWWRNDPDDEDADFALTDPLFNLAMTTVVRTDRPDRGYTSEPIDEIANRAYDQPLVPTSPQENLERSHRRQILTSIVDLRNVN